MKEALLAIVTLTMVFNVGAQPKNKLTGSLKDQSYKIDTFRYQGETILKQRYPALEVLPTYEDTSSNNRLCIAINSLQEELDNMNSYIVLKSNIDFMQSGERLLNEIKKEGGDFNCKNYQTEYDFYSKINTERATAKAERIKNEQLQREQERQRLEDEATAKEMERTRIKDSVDAAVELAEMRAARLNEMAAAREKKALEKELTKKYGATNAKAIVNGTVLLGMTKEMCYIAWGEPITTNKSIVKGMITERWTYGYTEFVVFKNGKVTMINE